MKNKFTKFFNIKSAPQLHLEEQPDSCLSDNENSQSILKSEKTAESKKRASEKIADDLDPVWAGREEWTKNITESKPVNLNTEKKINPVNFKDRCDTNGIGCGLETSAWAQR